MLIAIRSPWSERHIEKGRKRKHAAGEVIDVSTREVASVAFHLEPVN